MARILSALFVLAIAGCAGVPQQQPFTVSPCAGGEASYNCQVERYQNVSQ